MKPKGCKETEEVVRTTMLALGLLANMDCFFLRHFLLTIFLHACVIFLLFVATISACCDPGEDEEDSDAEHMNVDKAGTKDGGAGKINMTLPGTFAIGINKRPNAGITGGGSKGGDLPTAKQQKNTGYVDGKMTFAFDPTKF